MDNTLICAMVISQLYLKKKIGKSTKKDEIYKIIKDNNDYSPTEQQIDFMIGFLINTTVVFKEKQDDYLHLTQKYYDTIDDLCGNPKFK